MRTKLYEYMTPGRSNLQILESQDSKKMFMTGIFIQGEVQNQNGRVYPKNEIQKAVENIQQRLNEHGPIMGELDHPTELTINTDRVSHAITEMKYANSNGIGKLMILNTPTGKIVKELIEQGIRLGVSSRGSGNVNESGGVSDFDIVTIDIVAQPSAPGAYPKPIYESLYNMKGGELLYNNVVDYSSYSSDKISAKKPLMNDLLGIIAELDK